jgi:hypothetical protein
MNGWMDRWIEKLREGRINRHKDGKKDKWFMDGWTDGQTIRWEGKRLDGWMEGYVDSNLYWCN